MSRWRPITAPMPNRIGPSRSPNTISASSRPERLLTSMRRRPRDARSPLPFGTHSGRTISMVREFAAGNYRFIPAVFQYSGGAAAGPGYEIERVRFGRWLPLAEGFARVAEYIHAAGRPLTAFCACELRSPAAFTEAGFRTFNEHYVKTLAEWGIFDGTTNPVARSNVCPEIDPPAEPSFYAFSFTRPRRPTDPASPSFVIAGSAEAREGPGSYVERTVR